MAASHLRMSHVTDAIALGVFGRPHGVRGEIVFHPHNPAGTRLEALKFPFVAHLADDPRGGRSHPPHAERVTLLGARAFGDGSLVRLEGAADRDAVAAFTNLELRVPRAVLPPLGPGEYYVADLVGCSVADQAGRPRGMVTAVYWNGQHDTLEIRGEEGAELLIPAVPAFLTAVDLAARRLVIDDHE